jgi:Zn-dependent protease
LGAEAAGVGAVLLAFFAKFKGLLLLLLKFKWVLFLGKFAITGGSLILSIASWALFFGWTFAAGFVILIFVHEMGHVIALRMRGIKAGWPVFIPFMGAFVGMKEMPKDVKAEAEVAIAGPLLGTAGALVCYLIGAYTGNRFWYALAATAFFINLFNLIPVVPLDGGRVVAALSPRVWVVGIALLVGAALLAPGPGLLFIGVLIILSLPRIVAAFKPGALAAPYYQIAMKDRVIIAVEYFGLAAILAVMWAVAGNAVRVAGTA